MDEGRNQVKQRLTLAALLQRRMMDYGMTARDTSRAAGLHANYVRRILAGERMAPTPRARAGLCRALDIAPEVWTRRSTQNWELGMENGELTRCARCGIRNTGWRETDGLCPACQQGVAWVSAEDMLAHRRALLKRLEAEGDAHPGVARFRDEVRAGIERLERKASENTNRL